MNVEGVPPSAGARPGAQLGRHHRCEDAIGVDRVAAAVEEPLDGGEHRLLIADERQMILAGQLDQGRAWDVGRDVPPFVDR